MRHVILVLAVTCLGFGFAVSSACEAQTNYYYDQYFVGQAPAGGQDAALMSAWESTAGAWSGKFIDFTTGPGYATTNTAAAMDANVWLRVIGQFHPTGHMAIAKVLGPTGTPCIDFYAMANGDGTWATSQWLQAGPPQSPTWSVPTASSSQVMAMDVAAGFADPNNPIQRTEFLITLETFGGQITLGAYGLTDQWGNYVQPALVGFQQTGLVGTVLGIAIGNGSPGVSQADLTKNEIVFVVWDGTRMLAHSITFDIRTAAFGALNTATAYSAMTPLDLTLASGGSTTLGGIWVGQNAASLQGNGPSHDIAISIPHPNNPTGQAGTFVCLWPGAAAPLVAGNVGGGALCHVPLGDVDKTTQPWTYYGPSYYVFGPNNGGGQGGPHGWYVIFPGNPYRIEAVDRWGNTSSTAFYFFAYQYPAGAVPNGPPMCHPGAIGLMRNAALRKGALWVPYSVGGTPGIDFLEGVTWQFGPVAAVGHAVAQSNFPPIILNPPPRAGQAWPANAIIAGLAFLREYTLYLAGY